MMIIFTRFWRFWVIVLVILQTAGCWVGDQKYASVDLPENVQVAVISPASPLIQSFTPTSLTPTQTISTNSRAIQTATRCPADNPTEPAEISRESSLNSTPEPLSPDWIEWSQAVDHVGETLTVCGPVVSAYFANNSNGQPTFLNVGNAYPNPLRFTVVIWGSNRENFTPSPEMIFSE